MARKLTAVLGMGFLAFALTGCASNGGGTEFRGQCPPGACPPGSMVHPGGGCPPQPGMLGRRPMPPGARAAMMRSRMMAGRGACPPGGAGGCPPGGPGCIAGPGNPNGINLPFHPVHRNYYEVDMPRNLSYPADNTPNATVNYPYYTFKGPSDFFMDD